MMDFKSRVLRFKFNDETHELRFPKVKEIKKLQELQKKSGNEMEVLESMLMDLGMKKDLFDDLEVDHLNSIVESLINPKK